MPRASRERDLPTVRDDYVVRGWSYVEIQDRRGISRNTITSWRAYDEGQGNPNWDDLRAENDAPSLHEQRQIAAWRLAELTRTRARNTNDKGVVAEMTQLREHLDWLDAKLNNPDRHLDAWRVLVEFMVDRKASTEELSAVRGWIIKAADALKRGDYGAEDYAL